MSPTRILIAAALLLAANTAGAEVRIIAQDSGVNVRLRGISAVSDDVAWASGREGTVLRTVDGGKHWQAIKVPGAGELDFRDVEGFDADTAVVLSIGPGEASRVYRTEDGGQSWKLALQNKDPRAFFDCMAFDGDNGWMLGDPVEGRFQIYGTSDGGKTWSPAPGPHAAKGEAAFAASGTCIAVVGKGLVVATGGAFARAHAKHPGDIWITTNESKSPAGEAKGYFSVAASGDTAFLVGGDYKMESSAGLSAQLGRGGMHYLSEEVIDGAEARDGNEIKMPLKRGTIKFAKLLGLKESVAPRGYRSGVACVREHLPCISVGPSGTDTWSGTTWAAVSDTGYDAIDLVGATGWAGGDAGRIARIEVSDGY